jgi:hypothetical protein
VVGVWTTGCVDGGIIACVGTVSTPTKLKSDASTAASPVSALRIKQIFEPGAGLWCMGQIAWSPCEHVHSSSPSAVSAQNTMGAVANIPTWQDNQMAAMGPSARRKRVMSTTT